MKFTIEKPHREYFYEHHLLLLEQMLKETQLVELQQAIDETLVQRLNIKSSMLNDKSSNPLFEAGRDIWRENDLIRRVVANKSFAEIMAELIQKRPLRLGYCHYFPAFSENEELLDQNTPYFKFLNQNISLKEISCIQGLEGGMLICLSGEGETSEEPTLFCSDPGSGVYFDAEDPIDFTQMKKNHSYLLITYAEDRSVYITNKLDPFRHKLMDIGYSYGDRLKDPFNPILAR